MVLGEKWGLGTSEEEKFGVGNERKGGERSRGRR